MICTVQGNGVCMHAPVNLEQIAIRHTWTKLTFPHSTNTTEHSRRKCFSRHVTQLSYYTCLPPSFCHLQYEGNKDGEWYSWHLACTPGEMVCAQSASVQNNFVYALAYVCKKQRVPQHNIYITCSLSSLCVQLGKWSALQAYSKPSELLQVMRTQQLPYLVGCSEVLL